MAREAATGQPRRGAASPDRANLEPRTARTAMSALVVGHHDVIEMVNVAALVGSGGLGWLLVWTKTRRDARQRRKRQRSS